MTQKTPTMYIQQLCRFLPSPSLSQDFDIMCGGATEKLESNDSVSFTPQTESSTPLEKLSSPPPTAAFVSSFPTKHPIEESVEEISDVELEVEESIEISDEVEVELEEPL